MSHLGMKLLLGLLALVAVPAAIAAVVMNQSSSTDSTSKVPRQAKLLPAGATPLKVKGTGFRPGERVRLKAIGAGQPISRNIVANANGAFVATFRSMNACQSPTVTASGSRGSHASFNYSQIACIQQ
jgi:hypothetical protein